MTLIEESMTDQFVALGRFVRERRRALDLSQEELADRAGLSRAMIAKLETGATGIRRERIPGLARALQEPDDVLFNLAGFTPIDRTTYGIEVAGGRWTPAQNQEFLDLAKRMLDEIAEIKHSLDEIKRHKP